MGEQVSSESAKALAQTRVLAHGEVGLWGTRVAACAGWVLEVGAREQIVSARVLGELALT